MLGLMGTAADAKRVDNPEHPGWSHAVMHLLAVDDTVDMRS
jgi:hypothetical protein